jgi:hypothetical protein
VYDSAKAWRGAAALAGRLLPLELIEWHVRWLTTHIARVRRHSFKSGQSYDVAKSPSRHEDALDRRLRSRVTAVVDNRDAVRARRRVCFQRQKAPGKSIVRPVRDDDDVHNGTVTSIVFPARE